MIEIWLAFLAGLTGSFHCLGMCGGIVAALSMTGRCGALHSGIVSQLFYNLGRISTYTLLGSVAGFIGSSLDLPALKSYGIWFFCGANLFVIVVGLTSALGFSWFNLSSLEGNAGKFLSGPLRRALPGNSPFSSFPFGIILGFLPCGLVYAPLMVAMGSGSPIRGGAIMAALGLGTMPVLLIFGTASSVISGAIRNAMFRVVGLVVALMGIAGLWRVLTKMGHHMHHM
ncbi:MAG: sulfite exporter TauE/SafE family protein [Desulfuromonadales bacterium]